MEEIKCPNCENEHTYQDGNMTICPVCNHEWDAADQGVAEPGFVIKDSNGVALTQGDTVTVIKDLKIKGTSLVVKRGTQVKNIRLVEEGDHNIDCKIEGIGAMALKSEFVKKI